MKIDPNGYYKNKQTNKKTFVCSFHIGTVLYVFCLMCKCSCNVFIFLFPPPNPNIIVLFKKSSSMNLMSSQSNEVCFHWKEYYLFGFFSCLSSSLDKNGMFHCVVGFRSTNLFVFCFFYMYFAQLYFFLLDLAVS